MGKDESRAKQGRLAPQIACAEADWQNRLLQGRRWVGRIRKKFRVNVDPFVNQKVRRIVHQLGFRYILNDERLPGTPHLVFPKHKLVIFTVGKPPGTFRGGPPNPSSRSVEERAAWELQTVQKVLAERGWRCEIMTPGDIGSKRRCQRRLKEVLSANEASLGLDEVVSGSPSSRRIRMD